MNGITRDTMIHLLGGDIVTARRKAKRAGHSAWVGVVSLERPKVAYLNSLDALSLGRIHVRTFEIADDLVKYEDIGEEAAVEFERFTVNGTLELEALLVGLGIDPSTLAFKTDTEYPL